MDRVMDRVRILRILEYEGPRDWVESTVKLSVHGQRVVGPGLIRGTTIGEFPTIVKEENKECGSTITPD